MKRKDKMLNSIASENTFIDNDMDAEMEYLESMDLVKDRAYNCVPGHFIHTDAEGKTYLIAEMSDNHLLNMLKLLVRGTSKFKAHTERIGNEFQSGIYGVKIIDPYEAGENVRTIIYKAEPYVMEAVARGLEVEDIVREIMGRETAEDALNVRF